MMTRRVGSVLLLVQSAEPPSDSEWSECLDLLRPFVETARALVITEGGGPNPAQRKRLSMLIGGHPIRVAVVTDSARIRFVVASVALFIRRIRCFPPSDMRSAYEHLEMSSIEINQVKHDIADMRREMMMATPASSRVNA